MQFCFYCCYCRCCYCCRYCYCNCCWYFDAVHKAYLLLIITTLYMYTIQRLHDIIKDFPPTPISQCFAIFLSSNLFFRVSYLWPIQFYLFWILLYFYPSVLCVSVWTEILFDFFLLSCNKKTERAFFMSDCLFYLGFFSSCNIFVFVFCFCLWVLPYNIRTSVRLFHIWKYAPSIYVAHEFSFISDSSDFKYLCILILNIYLKLFAFTFCHCWMHSLYLNVFMLQSTIKRYNLTPILENKTSIVDKKNWHPF